MNLIPFDFHGTAVRVLEMDGEPWFVAADVASILEYRMASDMTRGLDDDEKGTQIVRTPGGSQEMAVISESGLYSAVISTRKPEAQRFKKWVTRDVLPSIRKTGRYEIQPAQSEPKLIAPAKDFRAVYGVLRLVGCDKNAAAIGANQATQAMHGTNLLQLTGRTHLEAENQESLFLTPTELGKRMDPPATPRSVNLLLAEAGYQMKRGESWEVLDAGRDFARILDTGKKHGTGVPVQQIKWAATVLPMLRTNKVA